MQPSLLEPDKNAKPAFLATLTLLAIAGISGIVWLFGAAWHPAAEITFFLIPGLIFIKRPFEDFTLIKAGTLFAAVLAGIAAGVLSHLLLPYWQQLLPAPVAHEDALRQYLSLGWWPGFGVNLLRTALFPAVCEEVFFRGLFFSELQKTHSPRFAFFFSALFFTLAHFVPAYLPLYFLLGLGAAWAYKTGGLPAAMLAHFVFNATGLVFWQLH